MAVYPPEDHSPPPPKDEWQLESRADTDETLVPKPELWEAQEKEGKKRRWPRWLCWGFAKKAPQEADKAKKVSCLAFTFTIFLDLGWFLMQDAVGSGARWRMGGASSLRLSAPRPAARSWAQGSSALRSRGGPHLPGAFHFYPTGQNLELTQDTGRQDAAVQHPPPKSHITPPGSRIQDISKRSWPLNFQPSPSFVLFQVLLARSVWSCSSHF